MTIYAATTETTSSGINFADIAFTIFVFLILLFLMKKFVFKKVINILDEREQKINTELTTSEENLKQSEVKLAESNEFLKENNSKIELKIKEANLAAQEERTKILTNAKADAQKIMLQAEQDIEMQSEQAEIKFKNDAIETAFSLASDILKKEITKETNQVNIDKFLHKKE